MDEVYICELCQRAIEPDEINGVRKLKEFNGYTVDLRLQQFRRIIPDEEGLMRSEFVEFASPLGRKLLVQMHEEVMRKTNKQWYPYAELGGYFKLEKGVLMGCPMNADGSRDDSPCEVDWYEAWDNDFNPGEIVRELEEKE